MFINLFTPRLACLRFVGQSSGISLLPYHLIASVPKTQLGVRHTSIRLKLRPRGATEWPIWISYLNPAVAPVLDIAQTELRRAFARDTLANAFKSQNLSSTKVAYENKPQRGGGTTVARWALERREEQMGGLFEVFRPMRYHRPTSVACSIGPFNFFLLTFFLLSPLSCIFFGGIYCCNGRSGPRVMREV